MNWIEITAEFAIAPADWSFVIDIFREVGSANVQELESPPCLVGCIAENASSDSQVAALGEQLTEAGAVAIRTRVVADEDWSEMYKAFFKPRRAGKRFMIVPTWEEDFEPEESDLVITLDPGQAFGTGDHPTTRMCLELLESADVAGKRVADVGCGTGILSIGAVLLGAKEVAAVDIDALSVEVTRANAHQNAVSFPAALGDGIASLGEGWDVVVSNIISATLIVIAPDVSAAVVTHGKWIVSGIILDNWPDVLSSAERAGFVLDQKLEDPQWVAAMFHRS